MTRTFETVADASERDGIILAESMPALTGNGPDDLLCGGCGEVLAAKLTPEAIASAFRTDKRLILRCVCGADNLVAQNEAPAPLQ